MSRPTDPHCQTLQFYATAAYPCSYLEGRNARSQVAAPNHLIDTTLYSRLVEQGFRRSGIFTYRPHCDQCQACKPIRVDANNFVPTRTQKRIAKRHASLKASVLPLEFHPDHYRLYQQYIGTRHPNAGMDDDSEAQYTQFLLSSRVETAVVEFRTPDGELKMVSIVDVLDTGLSAVYTFFDPTAAGSLGTYGVLWQIGRCRELGLPWLYLGYWIHESRKMAYKSVFRPHQIYVNGVWLTPEPLAG
ncbi:arginyltransferase [Pusillimonas minor]|uniref:Aspartate/glutamate leucyltransferase n=1 Tax=Pusillimonas minor TaxID=2697024 RepID=A0A842HQ20_9BURK|nr:arginyltransferase [Pusillimonas minor]MBC2769782.1 arginyltransferase [Pusillimonas minor]